MSFDSAACKVCVEFHVPEDVEYIARDFDAERFLRDLLEAGCDGVLFEAVDEFGNSLYDTRYGLKHPHLDRDLLREVTEAAQRLGVPIIAYYCLLNPRLAAERSWLARQPGRRPGRAGPPLAEVYRKQRPPSLRVCLNSPVMERVVLPQIREIASYPVDAFFFDFLYPAWPCACRWCRQLYRTHTGRDLLAGPGEVVSHDYLEWRTENGKRWQAAVYEAIRQVSPRVPMGANRAYTVRQPASVPAEVGYLTLDVEERDCCALNASLQARHWCTLGKPFEIMTTRFQHWWVDWALKPVTQMQQECATVLALGGTCHVGDALYRDGCLEPSAAEHLKDTFSFVRKRRPWCEGARVISDIAVLHSAETHYNSSESAMGDVRALRGCHKMLVESGFHFVIVDEAQLTEALIRYRLVILPDQFRLSSKTVDSLRTFVEKGGRLLAVGRPPVGRDEEPLLNEVLGVEVGAPLLEGFGYLRLKEPGPTTYLRMPLQVHSDFLETRLAGAESVAMVVKPAENAGFNVDPPGQVTTYPAVAERRFGGGRTAYVAADIFTAYFERNVVGLRHLATWVIDRLLPDRWVLVGTGEDSGFASIPTLEVVLARKDEDLVVHLTQYAAEKALRVPTFSEWIPPIHDLRVRLALDGLPGRITQQPEGRTLEWQQTEGPIEISVPEMHIHTALVVEGAQLRGE